jgi:hypothetical protein
MADFTDMGIEPKWTGMCAAWAIISPSRSKMAQEESRLSLMLGEKAVLLRVTPISSEMEENRFLKTSNKMGFSFTVCLLSVTVRISRPLPFDSAQGSLEPTENAEKKSIEIA